MRVLWRRGQGRRGGLGGRRGRGEWRKGGSLPWIGVDLADDGVDGDIDTHQTCLRTLYAKKTATHGTMNIDNLSTAKTATTRVDSKTQPRNLTPTPEHPPAIGVDRTPAFLSATSLRPAVTRQSPSDLNDTLQPTNTKTAPPTPKSSLTTPSFDITLPVCSLTDCLPFPTTNPTQNQITRSNPRTPKRLPACLPSRTTLNPESDDTLQCTSHKHQDAILNHPSFNATPPEIFLLACSHLRSPTTPTQNQITRCDPQTPRRHTPCQPVSHFQHQHRIQ